MNIAYMYLTADEIKREIHLESMKSFLEKVRYELILNVLFQSRIRKAFFNVELRGNLKSLIWKGGLVRVNNNFKCR